MSPESCSNETPRSRKGTQQYRHHLARSMLMAPAVFGCESRSSEPHLEDRPDRHRSALLGESRGCLGPGSASPRWPASWIDPLRGRAERPVSTARNSRARTAHARSPIAGPETLGMVGVEQASVATGGVSLNQCPRISKDSASSAKDRSEERRVGKECRSRWSPSH